jgi:TrpR family trp operon transcriptional repressor
METPEKFNSFLSLFLTFEERETMGSRYLIIKALLEAHLTQRKIAKTYNVSIAQITRGSNALKIVDVKFKEFLKRKL